LLYVLPEESRAHDLLHGLRFLTSETVQKNSAWPLFCPNEAPGFTDLWGDEFESLYVKYEKEVHSFSEPE
jgi:hypothetical protein